MDPCVEGVERRHETAEGRIAYWALGAISTCAPDVSDERIAVPRTVYGVHNWNPVWSPDGRAFCDRQ